MKSIILTLLITLSFTACQDSKLPSNHNTGAYIMGNHKNGINPNSLAYKSINDQKNRENKVELSQIDSNTKIEIAKIESGNKLQIAKVNADVQKEVAITDSKTKIKTSEIDAITKKDGIKNNMYITIGFMILFLIISFLVYLNSKKNRELKTKLHQEKLRHEQFIKEREFNEQRLHKMLELVEKGKLSPDMEAEVISSITKPKQNILT